MESNNNNYLNKRNIFVIGIFAIVCILISIPQIPKNEITDWIFRNLAIFGLSILITLLVAVVLNLDFQKSIHNNFQIIKGAEASHILKLYENRKNALPDIISDVERCSDSLDILAISGTSFFQPQCKILEQLEKWRENNTNINVRILLLNPISYIALERSLREEGKGFNDVKEFDFFEKKLFQDTILSLRQLELILKLIDDKSSFNLEVKLYNCNTFLLLVKIDNKIYKEQYHLGLPVEQIKSNLTKCLGKEVPVSFMKNTGDLGQLLISHFEYIWNIENTVGFYSGDINKIITSTGSFDIVEEFKHFIPEIN